MLSCSDTFLRGSAFIDHSACNFGVSSSIGWANHIAVRSYQHSTIKGWHVWILAFPCGLSVESESVRWWKSHVPERDVPAVWSHLLRAHTSMGWYDHLTLYCSGFAFALPIHIIYILVGSQLLINVGYAKERLHAPVGTCSLAEFLTSESLTFTGFCLETRMSQYVVCFIHQGS
jgi:hypothetical protein